MSIYTQAIEAHFHVADFRPCSAREIYLHMARKKAVPRLADYWDDERVAVIKVHLTPHLCCRAIELAEESGRFGRG